MVARDRGLAGWTLVLLSSFAALAGCADDAEAPGPVPVNDGDGLTAQLDNETLNSTAPAERRHSTTFHNLTIGPSLGLDAGAVQALGWNTQDLPTLPQGRRSVLVEARFTADVALAGTTFRFQVVDDRAGATPQQIADAGDVVRLELGGAHWGYAPRAAAAAGQGNLVISGSVEISCTFFDAAQVPPEFSALPPA